MIRRITFTPSWDKRDEDPARNYGIHCVEMHMAVITPYGVTEAIFFTNWFLRSIRETMPASPHLRDLTGAYIAYHRPGGPNGKAGCEFFKVCTSECGYTHADDIAEFLINEGSERAWKELEKIHSIRFS